VFEGGERGTKEYVRLRLWWEGGKGKRWNSSFFLCRPKEKGSLWGGRGEKKKGGFFFFFLAKPQRELGEPRRSRLGGKKKDRARTRISWLRIPIFEKIKRKEKRWNGPSYQTTESETPMKK